MLLKFVPFVPLLLNGTVQQVYSTSSQLSGPGTGDGCAHLSFSVSLVFPYLFTQVGYVCSGARKWFHD